MNNKINLDDLILEKADDESPEVEQAQQSPSALRMAAHMAFCDSTTEEFSVTKTAVTATTFVAASAAITATGDAVLDAIASLF